MTKIVYNSCFGGFGLNDKAKARYEELSGKKDVYVYELDRADPFLVQVVEEMNANDTYAELKIAELPAGTQYRIDEYDGAETVMCVNDYDWLTA